MEHFKKLFKDDNKEPYSFLVKGTTLSPDNKLDLGSTFYKMSISEKIKAFNNKIEQMKAQFDLERQSAKTSALSSGIVSKQEFLTDKDGLPEKD